jgi:hypothetical protein
MSTGDSDLRIRPRRIRSTRAAKPKSFINQVLRAAKKARPTSSLSVADEQPELVASLRRDMRSLLNYEASISIRPAWIGTTSVFSLA